MKDPSAQLYSQILTASGPGGQLEVLAIRKDLGSATLVASQNAVGKWQSGRTLASPRMNLLQLSAAPGVGNELYVIGLGSNGDPVLAATDTAKVGWGPGKALALPEHSYPFASIATSIGSDGNFQVLALDSTGALWVASWLAPNLVWNAGLAISSPVNADAIAVGMGNGGTYLQVFGLAGGAPYLLSYQGTDGSWNEGFAIGNPNNVSFASIASATTSDGTLFFIGLTSTGDVGVVSQDSSGNWSNTSTLGVGPYASIAIGTNATRTSLLVTGVASTGATSLVATYTTAGGSWTVNNTTLKTPDKAFGTLAVGPGDGGSIQVLALTAATGEPFVAAWMDQSGNWHQGFALPEQPPPAEIMTVRVGSFANPEDKKGNVVSAGSAAGAAVFTGFGELGFLYPAPHGGDEPAMSLRYARTREIDLYAAEGIGLQAADIDISSGWYDTALSALLVGGRANQRKEALCAASAPAVTVWDGITFFFWASQDHERIYGAYMNQSGDFSALIELYKRADDDGNGFDPLTTTSGLPSPVAYTLGDRICLVVPSFTSEKIEFHVFHPGEIKYSKADRTKEVFVNYANEGAKDQKPGHTTWVRSDYQEIPTSLLRKKSASDVPMGSPSIKHASATLNIALGRQAYLLLSVGYDDSARHDRIITIDEKTALPWRLELDERGIIVVDDGPKVDADEPRSIATVPNANIRSVSRAANKKDLIEIRYLDPSAFLNSRDNKVDFRKPSWVEHAADPSFTVPKTAQPLSGAIAQAVVFTPPYLDPDAPAEADPQKLATLLNVYSVFLATTQPKSTDASAKPSTVYLTRRLGTARQVPSEMRPQESSNPRRGIDGAEPGTGLAVNAIIDGPLPVPNSNINQLAGGFIGAGVAKLTVGTTHASSNKFTYEQYTGNGMDIEGSLTFAFSADLEMGLRLHDSGLSDKITLTSSFSAIGKYNFLSGATHGWNKVRTETAQSNYVATGALMASPKNPDTEVVLAPDAALFGTDPSLRMIRYDFLDNNGKLSNGKFTPFTVGLGSSEQVAKVIEPLSNLPGDLDSYTVERINQRMAKAYDELSEDDKKYFKASEYKDYFNNVVRKRAIVLASGKPFLEIAWSNAGTYAETSDQVAQKTNTSGWDFTWETKDGIGLDFKQENEVDDGFLFFSNVTKSSLQFKLQTLYWHKEVEKKSQERMNSNSFGLTADLGQLRAGYLPGDVISYTMRIYLLRPARQWTLEAALMGKKPASGLNLTSEPWKVMYTVHDVLRIPGSTRTNR